VHRLLLEDVTGESHVLVALDGPMLQELVEDTEVGHDK
jgi:hypothetical protein